MPLHENQTSTTLTEEYMATTRARKTRNENETLSRLYGAKKSVFICAHRI